MTIKHNRPLRLATIFLALFLLMPTWVLGQTEATKVPSFWKVEGKENTLWLFGSIHVLTEDHYPLAANVEEAFKASPKLVVEVDVVNTDLLGMQQIMINAGTLPPGTTLRELFGESRYARASELASASGYSLEQMNTLRPWLVTMMLTMAELGKLGYTPDHGVETYFLNRAAALDKTIVELETVESQLSIFTDMDEKTEIAGLMHTLEQLPTMETEIQSLIKAWEEGSIEELEETLLDEFADYPGLYKRLVTDRNRSWTKDFTQMLNNSEDDHFVMVGALHLVGDQGVVNLLREKGFKITRQ